MSARPGDLAFVEPADLEGVKREWHEGAVENKAHRLLITGKVRVVYADGHHTVAKVIGDTRQYEVLGDTEEWNCSCPSAGEGQMCSHIAAVKLISGEV